MAKENQGLGIASFVLGLMGLFISWIPFIGLPVCGLGLILGLVQPNWTQNGLSITGVTINGLFVLGQAFWIVMMFIGLLMG